MKNLLLLIALWCLLFSCRSKEQSPELIPANKYTRTEFSGRIVQAIACASGGFAVSGESGGGTAVFFGRISDDRRLVQKKEYDPAELRPTDMAELPDGGYILVGKVQQANGGFSSKMCVAARRIDAGGNSVWLNSYGDSVQHDISPLVVRDAQNNSVILYKKAVAGNPDGFVLLKLNDDGVMLWRHFYDELASETPVDVVATPDGGYMVAVRTNQSGTQSYLLKINGNGDKVWRHDIDAGDRQLWITQMLASEESEVVLAGLTKTLNNAQPEAWMAKVSAVGVIIWEKQATTGTVEAFLTSIHPDGKGGYITTGYCQDLFPSGPVSIHPVLMSFTGMGTLNWQRQFAGSVSHSGIAAFPRPEGYYLFSSTPIMVATESHYIQHTKADGGLE